jgi:hypothetical protein
MLTDRLENNPVHFRYRPCADFLDYRQSGSSLNKGHNAMVPIRPVDRITFPMPYPGPPLNRFRSFRYGTSIFINRSAGML